MIIPLKYTRNLYVDHALHEHGMIIYNNAFRINLAPKFQVASEVTTGEELCRVHDYITIERFKMREIIPSKRFNDDRWIKFYTKKCLDRLAYEINYWYQEQLLDKEMDMEFYTLEIEWEEINQWKD
jgi:hypothetical protein